MLNLFDFAPHSLRSGASQDKLREASRSLNMMVALLGGNLRRCSNLKFSEFPE